MREKELLRFEDVSYYEREKVILQDVNFSIRPGEFVSLIGPNGAGKSTLLKLLIGFLRPTRGSIYLQSGISLGYMPQKILLDPSFPITVERFMELWAEDQKQIAEVLEAVGGVGLKKHHMANLSGGELQRILLAKSLLGSRDLLVLDEPVQWVDVIWQRQLYSLIRERHRVFGTAILMVSHDLNLVLKESDRVICLNRHICCHGKPDVVQRDDSYREMFPEASLLTTYTHEHDHNHDV